VIVAALTASGLSIDVFEVTGGELLRVPEQVAILADVLQKEIRCIDIPVEGRCPGNDSHGHTGANGRRHRAITAGRSRRKGCHVD
jgi:hypothetical protein